MHPPTPSHLPPPFRALSGQQPEVLGTLVTAVGALLANGSFDHVAEASIHR